MPTYWVMNLPYSKELDELVNTLLDKYEFTEVTQFSAKLGDTTFWIANRPYNSMCLYNPYRNDLGNVRPSRLTIKRALAKLPIIKKTEKEVALINELLKKHK